MLENELIEENQTKRIVLNYIGIGSKRKFELLSW